MRGTRYSDKLKDPRWQKKRLEILERDEWKCTVCEDDTTTLHVHHLRYKVGKNPWDCDGFDLITLCESCHEDERIRRDGVERALLETLRDFLVDDLELFAECLAFGLVEVPGIEGYVDGKNPFYPGVEAALKRVAGWEERSIDAWHKTHAGS